jgi:hypothetical protein
LVYFHASFAVSATLQFTPFAVARSYTHPVRVQPSMTKVACGNSSKSSWSSSPEVGMIRNGNSPDSGRKKTKHNLVQTEINAENKTLSPIQHRASLPGVS